MRGWPCPLLLYTSKPLFYWAIGYSEEVEVRPYEKTLLRRGLKDIFA